APTSESPFPVAEPASSPVAEATVAPEVPAETVPPPEETSSFAEMASAAKEAVTAAVTELASAAASYLGGETSAEPEAAPTSQAQGRTTDDAAPVVELKAEDSAIAEPAKPVEEFSEPKVAEPE